MGEESRNRVEIYVHGRAPLKPRQSCTWHSERRKKKPKCRHLCKIDFSFFRLYLPQGYPRESFAMSPALENIPNIFQCRSSIHTHYKGLCNRIPDQNSFHRTISDLKKKQ